MLNMDKIRVFRLLGSLFFVFSVLVFSLVYLNTIFFSNSDSLACRAQNEILKTEAEFVSFRHNTPQFGYLSERSIGSFIFDGDSLVFWNTNTINPRLLRRRVLPGHDTICNLQSGDYYVSSFYKGTKTYYYTKLLHTTFAIDNEYFAEEQMLFTTIADVLVSFSSLPSRYTLLSSDGKVLSYFDLHIGSSLKQPYKRIVFALSLFFLVFAVLLLLSSFPFIYRNIIRIRQKDRIYFLDISIVTVILISLALTYSHHKISMKKENTYMKATAEKLLEKQDIAFEQSYEIFKEKVEMDSVLREIVFAESNVLADVVLGYSRELLFDDVMKGYSTSLTVCDPLLDSVQFDGLEIGCDDYFLDVMADNEKKRVGDGLYFMDYYTLDPNYLAKIKIKGDSLHWKTLYYEFYKPVAPEGFGFPYFLQDNESEMPYDYSVASYRDSILVYKYGKYVFPNFLSDLNAKDCQFTYTKKEKMYCIFYEQGKALVISTDRKGWDGMSALFCVFFLSLMIPVLVVYMIIKPRKESGWQRNSLGNRFQMLVMFTLTISFLLLGPISVIYMRGLYNQKTGNAQYETTRTLLLEMEKDLDLSSVSAQNNKQAWTEILQRFSSTFFVDLNLYGTDGNLIATTRPEIFENNLQAPLMNAEAFRNLLGNRSLYYSHEEKLGKGVYESVYTPIMDERGNTLAYLNAPYFSSKYELRSEIVSFVMTFLNIIILLLSFSVLLLLRVTRRLTKPLALIQNKMQNVQLDKNNEPIEWKSNDEIGALIEQYNQLIAELEKSANLIARNEREVTWREMARQVAHEIKNPLTPMQLSVQYLVKAYNDGAADIGDRLKRTASTLLEQINDLSEIATAFSSFAKLPENHPEQLDLSVILQDVVNLYNVEENIAIEYTFDMKASYLFEGDKTNLHRAFGNIVKNAVQAIGQKKDGRISIALVDKGQKYIVTVNDNGKGIKEEDKKKIFLPNFTTKSSGTGLGLAMVYNIIQAANGRINFESEEGVGTTFIVELFKNRQ